MLIFAIETSCDETGLALVEASGGIAHPRFKVLKNLISSQIKIHRPFGGVVPNLAKREHIKNLPSLLKKLTPKPYTLNPDIIAVTVGPGLEPALWTGITFAKQLRSLIDADLTRINAEKILRGSALRQRKSAPRLVGANHLEGHLYSFLLSGSYSNVLKNIRIRNLFPTTALIVSGGHTILLLMESLTKWKKLGETRDDAAGEAFDKVARMLKLPYPGGPEIEKIALRGNPDSIPFPRPMLDQKNYDFSFSGLKTAVFYYLRDIRDPKNPNFIRMTRKKGENSWHSDQFVVSDRLRADIAASFQQAVIEVLVSKTMRAAREFRARSVILCGGVAANKFLRKRLKVECDISHLTFYIPHTDYNTDNAAMIAAAGYFAYLKKKRLSLVANGDLGI